MRGEAALRVSIIMPTHNRVGLLRRNLEALSRQTASPDVFELIVAADGCIDGTLAALQEAKPPFALRWITLPGRGPAEARNAGAGEAQTPLLLFLDDDVEPCPDFIAAHLRAQDETPGAAILGPYPPAPVACADQCRQQATQWWRRHFEAVGAPGHRFTFRDVLTGNLSMPRDLWRAVGGLDPQFARAREDWELGVRLFKTGATIRYAPQAIGLHHMHATTTIAGMLMRAREEGRSDVFMIVKHPELAPEFKATRAALTADSMRAKFRRAFVGSALTAQGSARVAADALAALDARHWEMMYRRLYARLHALWRQRGMLDAVREVGPDVRLDEAPRPIDARIDLRDGLDAAAAQLSTQKPSAAALFFGDRKIGAMPFNPAAERWEGRHLRAFIAAHCAPAFVAAIAASDPDGAWAPDPDALRMMGNDHVVAQLNEARAQWRKAGLR